jgi:hypothetical protein
MPCVRGRRCRPQRAGCARCARVRGERANRHTALADAEERAQVAVARRVKNDALAEFVMGDPFAGLELSLYFHAPTSGDPQMEQASRLAAFAEQDLLRILVGLAPQNAAEREQLSLCGVPRSATRPSRWRDET